MEANPSNRREKGTCPVCGDKYDDATELSERRNGGEIEDVPGRAYDHDDGPLHIEWADGEMTQNHT